MTESRRTASRPDPPGRASRQGEGGASGQGAPSSGDPPDGGSAAAWGDESEWDRIRRAGGAWRESGGAGRVPPGIPELSSLLGLLEAARALVPRELEQQFSALVRELLLTLRALIDWYLERLDGTRSERRVEDIPID